MRSAFCAKQMDNIKNDESLDLSGITCPANSARALLKLEMMPSGSVLRLILDDGEPVENVPPALEQQRHSILSKKRLAKGWEIFIKRY